MPYLKDLLNRRPIRPKILVVDDQPPNIRLVADIFRTDCEVFVATGGVQALEICRQIEPDLILLDVMMPDLNGHEVCRRLKAQEATQAIPVIFLTSRDDTSDEVTGFDLGAVDFIIKPINTVIVRARVETHLALKFQADLLKSMALIDPLTGIGNRRQYEDELQKAWFACMRDTRPLSLIMIDIDHFKRYNDHYGHHEGDRCLAAVAGIIRSSLKRPYDLAARYGGEEFACVLSATDHEGAVQIATEICRSVRNAALEHAASDVGSVVTVSVGSATLIPRTGTELDSLFDTADAQLYAAKQAGRDRVCGIDMNA